MPVSEIHQFKYVLNCCNTALQLAEDLTNPIVCNLNTGEDIDRATDLQSRFGHLSAGGMTWRISTPRLYSSAIVFQNLEVNCSTATGD